MDALTDETSDGPAKRARLRFPGVTEPIPDQIMFHSEGRLWTGRRCTACLLSAGGVGGRRLFAVSEFQGFKPLPALPAWHEPLPLPKTSMRGFTRGDNAANSTRRGTTQPAAQSPTQAPTTRRSRPRAHADMLTGRSVGKVRELSETTR